jgi:hypothetical protein
MYIQKPHFEARTKRIRDRCLEISKENGRRGRQKEARYVTHTLKLSLFFFPALLFALRSALASALLRPTLDPTAYITLALL